MPETPIIMTSRKSNGLEGRISQAFFYQNSGRYRKAIQSYLQALAVDPNFQLHTMLGVLFELDDEPQQALVEHHHAVRKLPGDAGAYAGLAGILGRLIRVEVAAFALAQPCSNTREDTTNYTLACIEALDGNGDQALINLTDSLIESPEISRWAAVDPDLSSLKGHPLFDDLFLLKMSQPNWIETIES